jgi:hypothetical protein
MVKGQRFLFSIAPRLYILKSIALWRRAKFKGQRAKVFVFDRIWYLYILKSIALWRRTKGNGQGSKVFIFDRIWYLYILKSIALTTKGKVQGAKGKGFCFRSHLVSIHTKIDRTDNEGQSSRGKGQRSIALRERSKGNGKILLILQSSKS